MARSKQVTKAGLAYNEGDMSQVSAVMDKPERFRMSEMGLSLNPTSIHRYWVSSST